MRQRWARFNSRLDPTPPSSVDDLLAFTQISLRQRDFQNAFAVFEDCRDSLHSSVVKPSRSILRMLSPRWYPDVSKQVVWKKADMRSKLSEYEACPQSGMCCPLNRPNQPGGDFAELRA